MHATLHQPETPLPEAVAPPHSLFNAPAGLLSTRRATAPIGGRIRPGVKILTARAAKIPRVAEIYRAGIAAGNDFDAIEEEIRAAVPGVGGVFRPTNTPYFTVWARDFNVPETAAALLARFGSDRGDGEGRQLYRFPVMFHADDPDVILPHALRCWGAGQLHYWSEYTPSGTLTCREYTPIRVVDGKREIKPFGGRKTQPRADTGGVCNPEACREFQFDECKLNGGLRFYIPGIPSLHPFELPTTSWYSLSNIRSTLQQIARACGGRVSGYLYDEHTFWITKRQQAVSRITEEGKVVRDLQWLIVLEADIDMAELVRQRLDSRQQLARADAAALALAEGSVIAGKARGRASASGTESAGAAASAAHADVAGSDHATATSGSAGDAVRPAAAGDATVSAVEALKALRQALYRGVTAAGIATPVFAAFMQARTALTNWSWNDAALCDALTLLDPACTPPATLVQLINLGLLDKVRTDLRAMQAPIDAFERFMAARCGDAQWQSDAALLLQALELIDTYRSRAPELVELIDRTLDGASA